MNAEILIDNKNGNVWDILVSNISYSTQLSGAPGKLSMDCIPGDSPSDFTVNNGDIVRVRVEEVNLFYGYIFEVNPTPDGIIKITAYDQTRYLLNQDTVSFVGKTASEVIKYLCNYCSLSIGEIADTTYIIPTFTEDNKKLLDMMLSALDKTLIATRQSYVLYDDFGSVTLKNLRDMKTDYIFSQDDVIIEYNLKRSIDSDVYNRVKISKDNKEDGVRDTYIAQDSKNMAKWGTLQYYYKASENSNEEQIKELAGNILQARNMEKKTLSITSALGILELRAGHQVFVSLPAEHIQQWFVIEKITHDLGDNEHTMKIDLKVVN